MRILTFSAGIASLIFGSALLLFVPAVENTWIANAQLEGGLLAIFSGLYLTLVHAWPRGPTNSLGSPKISTLIRRDLRRRAFRSVSIGAAIAIIAGVLFGTSLFISGASTSVQLTGHELGADLVVVSSQTTISPEPFYTLLYAGTSSANNALPNPVYINQSVSSQVLVTYFSPTSGCGSLDYIYIVGVNQTSDSSLSSAGNESQLLANGGAIFGAEVPSSDQLPNQSTFFGETLQENGILPRTGTYLDHVIFISMDSANRMLMNQPSPGLSIGNSSTQGQPASITYHMGQVSAVFVKLKQGTLPDQVANQSLSQINGIRVYTLSSFVTSTDVQFSGFLTLFSLSGTIVWGGFLLLIAVIAYLSVNERKNEIGVFRAIGASEGFVRKLIVAQAILVTSFSGLLGILAAFVIFRFPILSDYLVATFKVPYLAPAPDQMALYASLVIAMSVATGAVSAFWPARRASKVEPYVAIQIRDR